MTGTIRLAGNTLVFLDTGFFNGHKVGEATYDRLLTLSKSDLIQLCTSRMSVEEWTSQKVSNYRGYAKNLGDARKELDRKNILCGSLLKTGAFVEADDIEKIYSVATAAAKQFLADNKIRVGEWLPDHIEITWSAYFKGGPPFKQSKNRVDIPDAWVFEAARNFLSQPEFLALENKFCISSDGHFKEQLKGLGYEPVNVPDLVNLFEAERARGGATPAAPTPNKAQRVAGGTVLAGLDGLLQTARNENQKEIFLRLAGYTVPLDAPSHEQLESAVAAKGFDRGLVHACAVVLADGPNPIIKNTGTHYVTADKEICTSAAKRLTSEIVALMEL